MKAIVKHIEAVYEAMANESLVETFDGETIRIYRGQVSKLYNALDIPQTYYTEIFSQLNDQGCITMLQRGSRHVNTVIVLHYPPSENGYRERPPRGLTSAEDFANMIEQVRLHHKLIGGINIVEAMQELEVRIERLEKLAGAQSIGNPTTNTGEKENG